jgi:hypothetical protein
VVVNRTEIPAVLQRGRKLHNRVDAHFWTRLVRRLLLLKKGQCLRIEWNSETASTVNAGCYLAAARLGTKVSVYRRGEFVYVSRKVAQSK